MAHKLYRIQDTILITLSLKILIHNIYEDYKKEEHPTYEIEIGHIVSPTKRIIQSNVIGTNVINHRKYILADSAIIKSNSSKIVIMCHPIARSTASNINIFMITTALQAGQYTIAYDKRGIQVVTVVGDLMGWTPSSVTVRSGDYIITYGDDGRQMSVFQA